MPIFTQLVNAFFSILEPQRERKFYSFSKKAQMLLFSYETEIVYKETSHTRMMNFWGVIERE